MLVYECSRAFFYFCIVKKFVVFSICGISILFASCEKEKTVPKEPLGDCFEISYQYNIRPIIENSCKTQVGAGTGCHDAWIDDYSLIQNYLNLQIWQTEIFVDKTMPVMPNVWGIDSLRQDELEMMQCWIDQGYLEN